MGLCQFSLGQVEDFWSPVYSASALGITWADLIQMASACAIQATGGPILPMKYGRVDVKEPYINEQSKWVTRPLEFEL